MVDKMFYLGEYSYPTFFSRKKRELFLVQHDDFLYVEVKDLFSENSVSDRFSLSKGLTDEDVSFVCNFFKKQKENEVKDKKREVEMEAWSKARPK